MSLSFAKRPWATRRQQRRRNAVGFLASAAVLAALFALPCVFSAHAANQSVQGAKKEEGGFLSAAPSAILIDGDSGSVLFEKNADQPMPPSSMMKLMTVEVVFNELAQNHLTLDTEFRVSEHAWRYGGAPAGGSTMFAAIHSMIRVEDLLKGAIIQSGNDSCMILAEGIAGNEDQFARILTSRARELGLSQATFGNATGLPNPENKMSVRELATLARHIVKTYPDRFKLFGEREFTWNKIRQFNRNPLLASTEGADGFKTGFTKDGGYGLVGTAKRGGTRLIVVVNGLETAGERAEEGKKLLEWGFRNFETRKLFAENQIVGYAKVFGGSAGSLPLVSNVPVEVMVQRSGNDKLIARVVYRGPVKAPIRKGQQIGMVKVWRNGNVALEAPLTAQKDIGTGTLTQRAIDGASELVIGLLRAGIAKL